MPVPHHVPSVAADDLPQAIRALRAQGLRVSAARRVVLEALFGARTPLTAEQIAGGAGGRVPRGDLGSVYRNLAALEAAGVARHTHVGQGPAWWSPATRVHEQVACERCGARVTLPDEVLQRIRLLVRAGTGFEVHLDHTPLAGLCRRCAGRATMRPACSSSSTSTAPSC